MIVDTQNSLKQAHRQKPDGTYDLICLNCFLTIGNADLLEELEGAEKKHICAPGHLSTFGLKPKLRSN